MGASYEGSRGGSREDYKQYPFRVLGVFKSEERLDNFAQRLLQTDPPIRHQFCLATLSDVISDPLGGDLDAARRLHRPIGDPAGCRSRRGKTRDEAGS